MPGRLCWQAKASLTSLSRSHLHDAAVLCSPVMLCHSRHTDIQQPVSICSTPCMPFKQALGKSETVLSKAEAVLGLSAQATQ